MDSPEILPLMYLNNLFLNCFRHIVSNLLLADSLKMSRAIVTHAPFSSWIFWKPCLSLIIDGFPRICQSCHIVFPIFASLTNYCNNLNFTGTWYSLIILCMTLPRYWRRWLTVEDGVYWLPLLRDTRVGVALSILFIIHLFSSSYNKCL